MSTFDIKNFSREKSICIEASAGTGKTYTVQMIVAKLLKEYRNDLDLNKILIVTFTEKAAGELRDRIRAKLREENLSDQLALVDNAPIYTIHSFCKQTLDEFSFEAHQCDSLSLIDESASKEFIEGWIRDELSNDKYFRKYHSLTRGKVVPTKTFSESVGKYYLDSHWQEVPAIRTLNQTVSKSLADIYISLSEDQLLRLPKAIYKNEYSLQELGLLLYIADRLTGNSTFSTPKEYMDNEIETFISKVKDFRDEVQAAENRRHSDSKSTAITFCNDVVSAYENGVLGQITIHRKFASASITQLFGNNPSQTQLELYGYFTDLFNKVVTVEPVKDAAKKLETYLKETYIPVIYKKWHLYKADNKLQSFDDMIRNVREAVCEDDSKLKSALQAKYKYAIIDEFQDTNQKQWDIFRHIFMEDNEHSICVVGDPKQSIYAFQGADVEVYSKAIKEISGTDPNLPNSLSTNYRSTDNMINFCNEFFSSTAAPGFFKTTDITFSPSNCPDQNNKKPAPQYNGQDVAPVWIPQKSDQQPVTEEEFAEYVVKQIIDCCNKDSEGKTKLQVYKKHGDKVELSNVSFKDFAVLCRSKNEMEPVKRVFAQSGIPYNHYKEKNLFGGKECRDWIALFSAINAPDFSSYNRKILSECLFSSFFDIPFDCLNDASFDEPDNPERIKILGWKKTAAERKWSLLQEQIYEKSGVEARLSSLDQLNSLTKLRQIGDYAVSYLYKNNCSLGELIDNLTLLSKQIGNTEEDEGELVDKGTDFDTVKIMTIHASKGLEFPVVIVPAGLKRKPQNRSEQSSDEMAQEFQRLFYVAYTRASSIMMLPWQVIDYFKVLSEVFEDPKWNDSCSGYLRKISFDAASFDPEDNKSAIQGILQPVSSAATAVDGDQEKKQKQLDELSNLAGWVKNLDTDKLSYSKLAHGKQKKDDDKDDTSEFDRNGRSVSISYDEENTVQINARYPKGNKLGEAVHQTFEGAEFKRLGSMTEEEVAGDEAFRTLIRQKFRGQGISIDVDDSRKIMEQTCSIVWNTLNAQLPEINGNHETGKLFSLKELDDNAHLAEIEFNMNPDINQNKDFMRDYFTGFIDLLFVREQEGKKIYSVLDWKTDSMTPDDYVDEAAVKKHTDKAYSIQRVLYSYCLIKWLKRFNPGKDEQWIFDNMFGGIYYAYVRGCKAGTCNGIYAQTWNCWNDLKAAFDGIVSKKIP